MYLYVYKRFKNKPDKQPIHSLFHSLVLGYSVMCPSPSYGDSASLITSPAVTQSSARSRTFNQPLSPSPAVNQPSFPSPAVNQPTSPSPAVSQPSFPSPAVSQRPSPSPAVNQPSSPSPAASQPSSPSPAAKGILYHFFCYFFKTFFLLHCVPLYVCRLCINYQDLRTNLLGKTALLILLLNFISHFVIDFFSRPHGSR